MANGDFPESAEALDLLRCADNIVCCDGAIDKMLAHGFTPTVIVGDLDSMKSETKERFKDILFQDKSEDYNDLQKALKYCQQQDIDHVVLLGCAGLRDDHFIANISIMATYAEQMDLVIMTDYGLFNAICETTTLESVPGQQVSVFSKNENLPLSFHGLKYPVEHRCFKHLWEGSLNEAKENTFTIELHGEGVVVVYRNLR